MRSVVFAYHDMGVAGLNALERAGYSVAHIYSHEDDPEENCWFRSVKKWGIEHGIEVDCPEDISQEEVLRNIEALAPDMVFSFYYRRLIPQDILSIPPMGAYNLHGSLLPDYRGRCPVNWVIINGEERTGVTLHHMVKKADAGDIVGQKAVSIDEGDTAFTLYGKMCVAAELLLDELLPLMKTGKVTRIPQDISKGRYFGGRRPEDGRINWHWPAIRIYNLIRAVTAPFPGAFSETADGSRVMIWRATAANSKQDGVSGTPGSIDIAGGSVFVQAGEGSIRLLNIEIEGKKMTGDEISRYFEKRKGMILI